MSRLMLCAVVSWLVLCAPAARADPAEDKAVKFVEGLKGKVIRDEKAPGKPVVEAELSQTKLTNAGLKELAGFKNLATLHIGGTMVTDAGLKELTAFKNLTTLDLGDIKVTDAGLKELTALKSLTTLHLFIFGMTDAGVKGIAIDILLAEPDRADAAGDEALSRAIRRNAKAVLPVIMEAAPGGQLREVVPARLFAAGAAAIGHVHVELDPDGIARSLYLREGLAGGGRQYLHLAAALVALAGKATAELPGQRSGITPGIKRGTQENLWLRDHWVHIAYLGAPGHFRSVPYADVLRGTVPKEALAGKLVLVGATAAGMMDSYPTPVSGYGRSMPGVELTANVVAGLRGAGFISIASLVAQVLASALLVLALMAVYLRLSARRGLLVTVLAMLGVFAATLLLVFFAGWWFAPSAALFGLAACYPVWSWRRLEAAQRYMDEELAAASREPELLPYAAPISRRKKSALSDELEARIEEVRRASARVRDMRRFVGDTLDGLPEAALVVDTQLRITLVNAQAAGLLGKPAIVLSGKRASEMLATVLAQGAAP